MAPPRLAPPPAASPIVEAKDSLGLAGSDTSCDAHNVVVELLADMVQVGEDERLLELEAAGDNVTSIFYAELAHLLQLERRLEEELFII